MKYDINNTIGPLKSELRNHALYSAMKSLDDIRLFMENHVYAVWDFMSLLKSLQNKLTCTSVPWLPSRNTNVARFINEIVHGEESDINEIGEPKSHFEMYLDAMKEVNANKTEINLFIRSVKSIDDVSKCLDSLKINEGVKEFTKFTFKVINSGKPHCIASAFTYGREDIIPEIFMGILNNIDPDNRRYNKLRYYLERHIEVDGDLHGPISRKMTEELCEDNDHKWEEALKTAEDCLRKRIQLWDTIYSILNARSTPRLAI